eukprot:gene63339-86635_t
MTAQSDLVRRYTVRISAFVRPILFQPSVVEDVAQMVFIKMFRRLTLLRDPAVFESWLFKLARNTAVDFLRRRRCRPNMVWDEQEFEQAPDVSSERSVAEIMEALSLALNRLSPKDRNLVNLIVEGNSYRTDAPREGAGAVIARFLKRERQLRILRAKADIHDTDIAAQVERKIGPQHRAHLRIRFETDDLLEQLRPDDGVIPDIGPDIACAHSFRRGASEAASAPIS